MRVDVVVVSLSLVSLSVFSLDDLFGDDQNFTGCGRGSRPATKHTAHVSFHHTNQEANRVSDSEELK